MMVEDTPDVGSSTVELVHYFRFNNVDLDDWIVTADVQSMYPNTNLNSAMEKASLELTNSIENIIPLNIIRNLVKLGLEYTTFSFNNKNYLRVEGVPMGSPAGPVLAVINIQKIIENNMPNTNNKFKMFKMYIDYEITIIDKGIERDEISGLLDSLLTDTDNPKLRWDRDSFKIFKIRDLTSNDLDFLDISIFVENIGISNTTRLKTKVYCKELGKYEYPHWNSCHPPALKRAIIKG